MPLGLYGEAMVRKLEIAEYHLDELQHLLPSEQLPNRLPIIAVQAHFEASGRAILSIADQLVSGVASVLAGAVPGLVPETAYLNRMVGQLRGSSLADFLRIVHDDVRHRDLRSWRNRSTHRFDMKAYANGWWFVAWPDGAPPYGGSRRIDEYIDAMVGFGHYLLDMRREAEDRALEYVARSVP